MPVGQRSGHASVWLPTDNSADGLFFFAYDRTLHLWPKERMGDGAMRMLAVAGYVDADGYKSLVARAHARVLDAGGDHPAQGAPVTPAKP